MTKNDLRPSQVKKAAEDARAAGAKADTAEVTAEYAAPLADANLGKIHSQTNASDALTSQRAASADKTAKEAATIEAEQARRSAESAAKVKEYESRIAARDHAGAGKAAKGMTSEDISKQLARIKPNPLSGKMDPRDEVLAKLLRTELSARLHAESEQYQKQLEKLSSLDKTTADPGEVGYEAGSGPQAGVVPPIVPPEATPPPGSAETIPPELIAAANRAVAEGLFPSTDAAIAHVLAKRKK